MFDIKQVKISTILKINDVIVQPTMKIWSNKVTQILWKIYCWIMNIINIINPVTWLRRIIQWTILKNGSKDVQIMCLDFLGSNIHQIYSQSKKLENKKENEEVI